LQQEVVEAEEEVAVEEEDVHLLEAVHSAVHVSHSLM
jgi:hypothetical protein